MRPFLRCVHLGSGFCYPQWWDGAWLKRPKVQCGLQGMMWSWYSLHSQYFTFVIGEVRELHAEISVLDLAILKPEIFCTD